jgi:hypothetical protein
VRYSSIEYFYCTGAAAMAGSSRLQSNCAGSEGTWADGATVCGSDAASE